MSFNFKADPFNEIMVIHIAKKVESPIEKACVRSMNQDNEMNGI